MTWLQRYRLKGMVRRSLWIMPVLAILIVLAIMPEFRWLDRESDWVFLNFSVEGARTVLSAFTSSMLTFVVFVLSSMVIVVQLASSQLTPRIIARVFADNRLKAILSLFTFSYTFTIAVSGRIGTTVPQFSVLLAIALNLVCIAIFFWFVQWLAASLRPIAILQGVADEADGIINTAYPEPYDPAERHAAGPSLPDDGVTVVEHLGTSGVVLAFDGRRLLALAAIADTEIEVVPQVGDFVAPGDPLFRVRTGPNRIDAAVLRACVAVGAERTLEQDPRFAFRIIADIANKALSPAINDPTTAVLALDQIHRLLMHVGQRRLDVGQLRDAKGHVRVHYGTPAWPDFVGLAVTELRHYGANSIQVARRLQAMLVHLLKVLPEARSHALQQELALLQLAIHRSFPDETDRARAKIGDFQGLGSSESP